MTIEYLERELSIALFRFSYGRISVSQANQKAKEVAPYLLENIDKIGHKSLNWYAQQLVAAM